MKLAYKWRYWFQYSAFRVLNIICLIAIALYIRRLEHGFHSHILFPYSNGPLHEWACNVVYEAKPDSKLGCYDICLDLAEYAERKGERVPVWVSFDEHGETLANACAITMNGAEW